jgi:hypothetical protein
MLGLMLVPAMGDTCLDVPFCVHSKHAYLLATIAN